MNGRAATKPPLPQRLSPSALTRYRTCPKQFLLCDLERVAPHRGNSAQLALANAVHEALQLFYGLDLAYRSAENAERCLRSVWKRHRQGAFSTREEEAATGIEAISLLRRYCGRFDISSEPLARERWVGVLLSGTRLYGKVDRIDPFLDGLDLIDYKTGRRTLDVDELKHESAVQVYVLGAEAELRLPARRVRLLYPAVEVEVAWELERDDVALLARKLKRTLWEISNDEGFVARPGSHCDYCAASPICADRGRVAIEEVAASAREAAEEMPF